MSQTALQKLQSAKSVARSEEFVVAIGTTDAIAIRGGSTSAEKPFISVKLRRYAADGTAAGDFTLTQMIAILASFPSAEADVAEKPIEKLLAAQELAKKADLKNGDAAIYEARKISEAL